MKTRPAGFVGYAEVYSVLDKSIDSVNNWADMTGDRFGDRDQKILQLNELKDIIMILVWRYSREKVVFQFTAKRNLVEYVTVADLIEDYDFSDYWCRRVHILEDEELTKVLINF